MSVPEEAVRLASNRFAVFPVNPVTKAPMVAVSRGGHGFKDASRDPERVGEMFTGNSRAVVGIACGRVSDDIHGRPLLVLDMDPRHGGVEGLEAAQANLGALPATAMASTPSGGTHRYFRVPSNVTVSSSVGKPAPGLDIRCEGGYVVAPPAPRREWRERLKLAELSPAWLEAIGSRQDGHTPRVPGDEWAALLRAIPDGQRNQSLARIAGHLLAKDVSVQMAAGLVHMINRTACQPPLDTDEVDRVLDSIARAELSKRQRRTR